MINLEKLNNNQKIAVTSPLSSLLIVAGAGTGKTNVLTTRIAYLIDYFKIDPNNILAITFTNKAAAEMRDRVNKIIDINIPWIGTFHGIALKILRDDINKINKNNNFGIIDDEDERKILKEIISNENMTINIKPNDIVNGILNLRNNNLDINLIDNLSIQKKREMFGSIDLNNFKIIYLKYEEYKKNLNILDFDDLLIFLFKLLNDVPTIRKKWQEYFKYILVDEFQDTNELQFNILKLLINENKNNITVVGDPDQTIYTWRGAYANIFNDFLDYCKDTITVILDLNYRSTKNILKAANSLIKNNKNRIKKDLITSNDVGSEITYFHGQNQYDEAMYIANKIKSLIKNDSHDYKDIAILYRSNYISRNIEQELINCSIPYKIIGGIKFYQRMEIKDLLAYMKLLDNENDELSMKRIINVPRRGIGDTVIKKIDEYAKNNFISFIETMKLTNDDNHNNITWNYKQVLQFTNLINDLRIEIKDLKLSEKLLHIIKKISYMEYLKNNNSEEQMQNVNELVNSLINFETKNENATMHDFLEDIVLYSDNNNQEKNNVVVLMTIHMSKGIEFKTVFLIGMNEGTFPISNKRDNDLEEERRIAYVALTRAKEHLYISSSDGYSYISNSQLSPSRFIKEIGSDNYKCDTTKFESISKLDLSWYDSKKIKNYDEYYSDENIQFNIGDTIIHTVFGTGTIIGKNNDFIDIAFKSPYGVKTIISTHKSIKRLKR
ncbi:MAG: exodeoxyribonuclease V subunit gamma [Mycoplasmataceae bacterium]|nr:exodeoxyribonuclease V subunit gamma [Mycoplasmataceae bacterium]